MEGVEVAAGGFEGGDPFLGLTFSIYRQSCAMVCGEWEEEGDMGRERGNIPTSAIIMWQSNVPFPLAALGR